VGDGRDQSYAVTTTGSVYAWGYNAAGQLGDGTTTQRSRPVQLALTNVTGVQGGSSHAVFLRTTGTVENQPPQARFTSSCSALACMFNATSSTDPDGEILATSWSYGDGATGSGATSQHTFAQSGTYQVTVTVTDNDGATAQASAQVQVSSDPPPATPIAFVGSRAAAANASSVTIADPAGVQSGHVKVLVVTANRSDTTMSAAGWTAGATVVDESMKTQVWYRVSPGGSTSTTVTASAAAKLEAHVLVYSGVDTAQPVAVALAPESGSSSGHATPVVANVPSGAWALSYWADKSATTTGWTPPAGVIQRLVSVGSGSGRIAALSADSGGPVAGPSAGGLTAVASAANSKAVMGTVILRPAS
jgi:PKD repeat protein